MKKVLVFALIFLLSMSLMACKKASSVILNWDVISNDLEIDTSSDVTIVFWHTMSKTINPALGQQALLDVFITEFNELYPHITVLHEQKGGYDQLRDAINTALPAGNEPHMSYSYSDHVAGYINSGRALPLNNLINNLNPEIALSTAEQADYVDGYWAEGSVYDNEGTVLNLPFVKSTEVMFYNKTFFDKFELDVPSTWDEVLAVSQEIRTIIDTHVDYAALTPAQRASIIPFGYDSEANLYITASEQLNIPYTSIGDDLKGQILFNNAEAKNMVAFFKDMYDDKLLTSKEMLGGAYTSDNFRIQKLFMSVGSTGGTNYNVPEAGAFVAGVAPLPQFDNGNQKVIQQGPNVNLFLKDNVQEMIASWLFLKYITAPSQTSRWAIATGYSPVRESAFETVNQYYEDLVNPTAAQLVFKAVAEVAQAQIPYYYTSVAFDRSSKAREQVGTLIVNVFGGTYTIEEAFNKAYEEVNF
ncbi:MAG: extracellular solute-binding protein [Acholeplasmataceae bacterium]|nr:extracellular solute-binding protein [Acholeplasmataceae bacterium]